MSRPRNTPSAGLTLIELVVVMALFALVAVMGVQSLTGTLRISERLRGIDENTASLGAALALIRNDLSSVVPMRFYPPQAAPHTAVWRSTDTTVIGLSLAGQPGLAPAATNRHRVEWQFDRDAGVLTRRQWPTLIPVTVAQLSPEATVLTDVTGLTLRTSWPGVGWVDGATPPVTAVVAAPVTSLDEDSVGPPPAAYFSMLPDAIELVVQTRALGDLRIIQVLR